MVKAYEVLVLNLGSTSSKVAVYRGECELFCKNIVHEASISERADIESSTAFRRSVVYEYLESESYDVRGIDAVVARGGLLAPMASGCYEVTDAMVADLASAKYGEHASNVSAILGLQIARSLGVRCYIVDPVIVDELSDVARISGSALIERSSIFHALNHKAVARLHAASLGRDYEDLRLIVAHMGGGITVGAHDRGKVVEVNNGFMGEGPMSPNRPGGLPTVSVVQICEELHSEGFASLRKRMTRYSGLMSYFGTDDVRALREREASGDAQVSLVLSAMAYQIAKEIGACAAVLHGKVDAILLTGGLANDKILVEQISEMTRFISEIAVYPGENEMRSLALGCLRVL
ncbi:MAG: butyrate kinase [Bradymonadales bacterium]|jgi:butyrate kinase